MTKNIDDLILELAQAMISGQAKMLGTAYHAEKLSKVSVAQLVDVYGNAQEAYNNMPDIIKSVIKEQEFGYLIVLKYLEGKTKKCY